MWFSVKSNTFGLFKPLSQRFIAVTLWTLASSGATQHGKHIMSLTESPMKRQLSMLNPKKHSRGRSLSVPLHWILFNTYLKDSTGARHCKNPIPSMCLYACPRWLITHCVQSTRNGVTFPGSVPLRLTYQYKLLLEHIEKEKPPHGTFREI